MYCLPQMSAAVYWIRIDTPIAVMSGARRGARRSGRYATRSTVTPSATHTSIAAAIATSTIASGGKPLPARSETTVSATSAPTITMSPCAKLMSPRMP